MAGFIGSGDLFFNRVVNGVSQGFIPVGNATKFAIQEQSEIKERKSKQRATYGNVLDSVAIKQPGQISIAMDDLNAENLALAFLGTVTAVNTGAGANIDEQVTLIHDSFVDLAERSVSAVVVGDDAVPTTTYVLGVDYELDASLGMIKALPGGSITDGQTVFVDYSFATTSGKRIDGGADPTIKTALRLNGKNFANDEPVVVDVFEAVLAPTSEVDFLSDDFATIELAGTLNIPAGQNFPYTVELLTF